MRPVRKRRLSVNQSDDVAGGAMFVEICAASLFTGVVEIKGESLSAVRPDSPREFNSSAYR